MPMALLAPSLIGAGASIFGSILGNKKKEQTSTSTPTLSPELQAIMQKLMAHQQGIMDDPAKGLAPIRSNQMEQVNSNYAGAQDRISTQLAKRGYSGSGKAPGAFVGLERGRLGELGNIDSNFAQIGSDRQMQAGNTLQQLLSRMTGTSSTGTSPGNAMGAGFSAAGSSIGNISTLMTLQNMLKGNNGGGGYSDPGSWQGGG